MRYAIAAFLVSIMLACTGCPTEPQRHTTTQPSQLPAVHAPKPPPMSAKPEPSPRPNVTINTAPGQSVTIEEHDVVDEAGPGMSRTDKAAAAGSSMNAMGQTVKTGVENQPSRVGLSDVAEDGVGGGGAVGESGGSTTDLKLTGATQKQMGFYGFGMLFLVAAAVLFYFGLRAEAMIVGGLGLLFIALGVVIETAPWVFWIAIAAVLVAGGFLLYRFIVKHKTAVTAQADATTATAAAVEATDRADAHETTATVLTKVIHDIKVANPVLTNWIDTRLDHHTDAADDDTVIDTLHDIKRDNNLKPTITVPPMPTAPVAAPVVVQAAPATVVVPVAAPAPAPIVVVPPVAPAPPA